MPKAAAKKRATASTPKPERPDWLRETPVTTYSLEAFSKEIAQQVDLTFMEYEALKLYLAYLRGFDVKAPTIAEYAAWLRHECGESLPPRPGVAL